MFDIAYPVSLSDLASVFERLDQGNSVALMPSNPAHRPEGLAAPPAPSLGVCSSGSTGIPKLIWRRWDDLRTGIRPDPKLCGWQWASPFEPWTFAGVQIGLQAWSSHGHPVSIGTDWGEVWTRLADRGVEALCCTPTYADLLIQNQPAPAPDWTPRQITLGGEVLRPATGARLSQRFPKTRFTVIYAAAEVGNLLKTHRLDGWYELESMRVAEWRIEDGALTVRRGDRWHRTGDLVERKGDLLRVVGRADSVANVAGTKVSLAEVAEMAEQVPGVRRALAVAEPNPVTGQVVVLRYALELGRAEPAVLEALQAHLRGRLRKEAWPRRWVKDEVGLASNAKRGG
ncbi:MAG TPA: class I adenylate-forming enzyme family protein [Candidatus Paceibacterota bacterium]|nr:class I adenylate-forming enzyme family protein [Verrucomicrobiota bacterium]HRZ56606.1 class I adenylate-forming enzyme family protein [Candidatus Paceibacterota bacterium]